MESPSAPPALDVLSVPKTSSHGRSRSTYADSRNSSLNTKELWAEDYYNDELESSRVRGLGLHITPPPAAATTTRPFPSSVPLEEGEDSWPPRQPRTHQRSLTEFLPFSKPQSRETSPKKLVKQRKDSVEDNMGFTGDKELTEKKGGLAGWFSGSSAPLSVGIAIPSASEELVSPSSSTTSAKSTAPSLFNFFASPKSTAPTTISLPQVLLESDPLLTLDIKTALYPSQNSFSNESFSPAAFKNLQQNAEGLLLKLQNAYKVIVLEHHNMSMDNGALDDEIDEAETRAECLKTQLDEMASRASEQDKLIETMVLELAHEKQMRAQEREAREKSIALVRGNGRKLPDATAVPLRVNTSAADDSDSDDADSVFSSRPTSLGSAGSSVLDSEQETPEVLQAEFGRVVAVKAELGGVVRPKLVQQSSTFQKILAVAVGKDQESGCSRCEKKDVREAWVAVGGLRRENEMLRQRVGDLEDVVDGVLGDIAGFGH